MLSEKAAGIGFIAAIAAFALVVANYVPLLSGSLTALLFGAIVANLTPLPSRFKPGIKFCEKSVLEWAIVLMGFGISFTALTANWGFLALVISTLLALGLGMVVAKQLGYQAGTSTLVGIGCAICGSAAIAAAQKPLKASQQEVANALAAIHIVGFAALFIVPMFAELMGLSPTETALALGGSLPAMGHVVAAGFSFSQEVGEQATMFKLARVALLLPVLVCLYMLQPRSGGDSSAGSASHRNLLRSLPLFMYLFAAVALLRSVVPLPEALLASLGFAGKITLTMALAAIGCQLNLRTVLKKTPRALQLAAMIIGVQVGVLWAAVV